MKKIILLKSKFLGAIFVLILLLISSNQSSGYTANLMSSQTFSKPAQAAPVCGDASAGTFTSVSAGSGSFSYATQAFSVSSSGNYRITCTGTTGEVGPDPMIYVYQGSFDPSSPTTNFMVGNDDIVAGTQQFFDLNCQNYFTAGISYVIVITTYNSGAINGTVDFSITGTDVVTVLPTVTTASASSIGTATASSGGNVTNDGGATVSAHGIAYGTSPNPTISGSTVTSGSGTGSFTSDMSGLTRNTYYYVRAYATNSVGTAYGNQIGFTTLNIVIPTVTTDAVGNISTTTAIGQFKITDTGGELCSTIGVCWNTTGSPTSADSHHEETAGGYNSGPGGYFQGLFSLTPNTKYYVRAYAVNSAGTGYGNELDFTTVPLAPVCAGASAIHTTDFTANWTEQEEGDQDLTYTVRVSDNVSFSPYEDHASIPKATLSHLIDQYDGSPLIPNTMYYYKVFSTNATGSGAESCTQTPTTLPLDPTCAVATSIHTTDLTANWAEKAEGPETLTYTVRVSDNSGFSPYEDYASLTKSTNSLYIDQYNGSALIPNTMYYYKVFATNAGGVGAESCTQSPTTLPLAPGCSTTTAKNIHITDLEANWFEETEGPEPLTYTVQFSKFDNSFSDYFSTYAGISKTTLTQFISTCSTNVGTVEDLRPNTMYYYRVMAHNASGYSAWSCTQHPTTRYFPPRADSANVRDTTSFRANWTPDVNNGQSWTSDMINGPEPFTFNLYVDCGQGGSSSPTTLFNTIDYDWDFADYFNLNMARAQSFSTGSSAVTLTKASFWFGAWDNTRSYHYSIELWNASNGEPTSFISQLDNGLIDDLPKSEGPALYELTGLNAPLDASSEYAIVIKTDIDMVEPPWEISLFWIYSYTNYSEGYRSWSSNNGSSWVSASEYSGETPFLMKLEGGSSSSSSSEIYSTLDEIIDSRDWVTVENYLSQSFSTGGSVVTLNKATLLLNGSDETGENYNYSLELYNTDGNGEPTTQVSVLSTGLISDIINAEDPTPVEFTGFSQLLSANTEYAIVLKSDIAIIQGELKYPDTPFGWFFADCGSCGNGSYGMSDDAGDTWRVGGEGESPYMMKLESIDNNCSHVYRLISSSSTTYNTPLNDLSPESHYNYWLTGTNIDGEGPESNHRDFWTLSPEPKRHARTFYARTQSATQIDVTFEPANNITDCDGYLLIQRIGSYPTWLPIEGTEYASGYGYERYDIYDGQKIAAIITNKNQTSISLTGLSRGNHYYFTLIPFNWDMVHPATYNYLTNPTIPRAEAEINPPTVTTGGYSDMTTTTGIVRGTVSSNGSQSTARIEYGETTSYGNNIYFNESPLAYNAENIAMAIQLTGLNSNTIYHYRAVGTNVVGTTYGRDMTCTTRTVANDGPTIQDYNISFASIRPTTAQIRWTRGNGAGSFVTIRVTNPITDNELPVSRRAYSSYSNNYTQAPAIGSGKIVYYGNLLYCNLTSLSATMLYYVRVSGYNGNPANGTALFNRNPATNNPNSFRTPRARDEENLIEATKGSFSITNIFPNPATEAVEFTLDVPESSAFTVEIFDLNGERVIGYCENQLFDEGNHVLKIDLGKVASGSYTLVVKSGADMAFTRFNVVK